MRIKERKESVQQPQAIESKTGRKQVYRVSRIHHPCRKRKIFISRSYVSNFSQVRIKLLLLVNLRPRPFSPSRRRVLPSMSVLMIYIFPVILSLNLSPIFSMTPPSLLTPIQELYGQTLTVSLGNGTRIVFLIPHDDLVDHTVSLLRGHWFNSLASRSIR